MVEKDIAQFKVRAVVPCPLLCLVPRCALSLITHLQTQLKAQVVPDPDMSVVPSCFSTPSLATPSTSFLATPSTAFLATPSTTFLTAPSTSASAASYPSPLPQPTPLGSDVAAGTSDASLPAAPFPGTPLFLSTQETLSMRKMRVEANMTEIISDYFETRMPVVEGMGECSVT